MSTGRKFLLAGIISLFVLAKIFFALKAVHVIALLAIPAFLLILTEPAEAQ